MSHNEGDSLARTIHRLLDTLPPDGEIVVVDDESSDGSTEGFAETFPDVDLVRPPQRLGAPSARNYGARRTSGRMIVFADAHIDPPPGWVEAFTDVLADPAVGAAGPAVATMDGGATGFGRYWIDAALTERWLPRRGDDPYPVPILGGFFLALRRDVFERTAGFDDRLIQWGSGDAEISLRLWLLGYHCLVIPTVAVAHLFRASFPYALATDAPTHNLLRLAGVHLSRSRFALVVEQLRTRPSFPAALARLVDGDASHRRAELKAQRRFDDDWYCSEFGIDVFDRQDEERSR